VCGHSSRRRVAADTHQRPTRRFRPIAWSSPLDDVRRRGSHAWSSLAAPGRHRARTLLRVRTSLPIWSCSVWGLPCHRHYCRRGALLPHLFTLTTTAWGSLLELVPAISPDAFPRGCPTQWWRYVLCGTSRPRALTPASRTLSGTLPCGVRTFLSRSSACADSGSDRPVLLPPLVYREIRVRCCVGQPQENVRLSRVLI
jgi:hypothetical protein